MVTSWTSATRIPRARVAANTPSGGLSPNTAACFAGALQSLGVELLPSDDGWFPASHHNWQVVVGGYNNVDIILIHIIWTHIWLLLVVIPRCLVYCGWLSAEPSLASFLTGNTQVIIYAKLMDGCESHVPIMRKYHDGSEALWIQYIARCSQVAHLALALQGW